MLFLGSRSIARQHDSAFLFALIGWPSKVFFIFYSFFRL
ncbi:putative membrane protein [Synechococcus sp. A15-62]|nr:putative membrane protein [Synechococcus sp. A15-62]